MPAMKYQIPKGDRATPILVRLRDRHDRAADLAGRTLKFRVAKEDGTEVVAETDSGIVAERERTFTLTRVNPSIEGQKYYLTDAGHPIEYGDELVLSPAATLPVDLYYYPDGHRFFSAEISANTFSVSGRPNEAVVPLSTPHIAGTTYYRIIGSAEITLPGAVVQNVGEYRLWIHSYNGVTRDTYPSAAGIVLEVLDMGA